MSIIKNKDAALIILGIHIGHDASAAIIEDGIIKASIAEERFVRIKHYGGMPFNAIKYCLGIYELSISSIDYIVYSGHLGDKRLAQFFGVNWQLDASTNQIKLADKFKKILKDIFIKIDKPPSYFYDLYPDGDISVKYIEHHRSHAASAYFTSGNKDKTLVITSDGAGEDGYSLTVSIGEDNKLTHIKSYPVNCSYGLFYGLITEILGWWVGDGEGTTMGLAPYGNPNNVPDELLLPYLPVFKKGQFLKPVNFGRIDGFQYLDTHHWHFHDSEQLKIRLNDYSEADIAAKAQVLLEREIIRFLSFWKNKLEVDNLAAAGGVFLNVKMNQKIAESGLFEDFYIYPDAGDAGIAVGAALDLYHSLVTKALPNRIRDIRLGPSYKDDEIQFLLDERNLSYIKSKDICQDIAQFLADGKIVGWFQGREECGPRALGGRSILFDPTKAENKDIINKYVKFRQPFRPFCPSMPIEYAPKYLEGAGRIERYMITSYNVKEEMKERIPAVTHIDGTCRPQMVERDVSPLFWELLNRFGDLTGTPVLINTSFNIKGEPIVSNPRDAIKCFFDTGIHVLALGSFYLVK